MLKLILDFIIIHIKFLHCCFLCPINDKYGKYNAANTHCWWKYHCIADLQCSKAGLNSECSL